MIGKVREYAFDEIQLQIYALIEHAKRCDDLQVVTLMKELVKEYKAKTLF